MSLRKSPTAGAPAGQNRSARNRKTTIEALDPRTAAFYCQALSALIEAEVPFLVGGAYAFARYTGIERHTKDFDIFVRKRDCERTLAVLERAGFRTDVTFPHWLAKALNGEDYIDVIFGAGNGVAMVDEEWFEHAVKSEVLDLPVNLCPPEEMIWSKASIQERERYDGADVAHLLRACAEQLDWERLLRRFGKNTWRVLLGHLVLFGFIYPAERTKIPAWVLRTLTERLEKEIDRPAKDERLCQGTLLSRQQYLVDVDRWGYRDAREVHGTMTRQQIAHWTAAIEE